MDAFDNPAKGGMGFGDNGPLDQSGQAANGSELLRAVAATTAAASMTPITLQTMLVPDARGRIVLPAGASLDAISIAGNDLIIALPGGQILVIPNGAVEPPAIVIDGDTVPASTVAQLLEGLNDLNPEAGVQSSGGNFADPEGAIGDPYALGDLLPYTELSFPEPRDEEIIPAVPDEEADVIIQTPNQPAGSTDATASVDEAGLPARGSEPAGSNSAATSETTTGTILFNTPDGLSSVTINGTAVTAVGQTITTPLGTLTITSIGAGSIGYSYALADNTDANANPSDIFTVVVTDRDGDTATARLTISVVDDVPTARADTDAVTPATYTAETGNVISGTGTTSGAAGADTRGADGATLTGIVAGTGTAFVAPGTAIAGQYGTLTINADGSYSYVRAPNTPGGVSDVFTYRLTDGDGDTSTATLTISIGDSPTIITFVPTQGAGTVVDESQLPPRPDETPGSEFDGDEESTTGTITFTSPDGVQSVTINGVAVTPGALPQTIFTDATGTLVINSYSYDPVTGQGSITYTYTLADNTVDPDGTTVSFAVVVTDLDGDSAPAVLDIDIIDDTPVARDDADSVAEDGALIADGNVLTGVGGSDANDTDGVADTPGADGATVTAVAGGTVGTPFATAYGTLTINADGSYSYVLNNEAQPVQGLSAGETLTEAFVYTITDGDGDTSTATLTITINGADDGVTINGLDGEGGELTVDEDDLPNGSSPDPAALAPSGSFSISTPDGLGNVTIGGTQVVTNGIFTAGSATSPLGTVNITGFTPVVGADGSVIGGSFTYEYVLSAATATHSLAGEDRVTDSFAVVVTDSDGSVGNASLDVAIIDDVPTARDDADSVTEDGALIADGNVLTGAGGSDANDTDGVADTQGADGATVTAVAGGTVGTPFATAYGTLTINADGSYSYVLNNGAQPVQGLSAGETLTEAFVYTITDGDGDTSTATLTITINGADDGVTINGLDGEGAELFFDEDDLPARPGEASGSDTTPEPVTDGGSFSVSTPDGMGTVVLDSFNGSPIGPLTLVTADGSFTPQSVVSAYGTLSITGFTAVFGADGSVIGGSFTYSYTLSDNRTDHGAMGQDGLTDSIGVTVTDSDGSTASDLIDIRITDDVPSALDDALTQLVENAPVTIDVLANDVQGADSVQPGTVALVDGTLTGNGTLVNNGDGTFTYTQAPGEVGEVSFQYQITDGDGDTSTATATITLVADSSPQIKEVANVTVDEDGLPAANADGGFPGEVNSTGSATGSGSITVDFGSDVPAVLAGSIVLDLSAGLDTQLTVDNVPVTFTKDGADLVGSVGGTEVIRIALTTPTAGSSPSEVVYGYTVTLKGAIDQAIAGSEDDALLSGIGFTVTDSDGTTASGSFAVTIVDDLPTLLVSDTPTNATEGGPAVEGSWTLDAGADGVSAVTVTFGSGSETLALTPGASVVIVQPVGTLTVNSDGTFSFLAAGDQNNALNPSATFTLSAVDRDGDPTSDELTITIDDGANPVGGGTLTLTVDEAAIDAIGRNPGSDAETDSGMLSFTAGSDTLSDFRFDGVGGLVTNLDGSGPDIFWTISLDGQTITGALSSGGPAAITISLNAPASLAPGATGNATVTVTIADNLPHELAMAAQTQSLGTVTVQATDTDGDVATGTVTIDVIDDIPTITAVDGAANALTVDETDLATDATADFGFGQPGSLFNLAFNADGPASVDSVVYTLGVQSAGVASGLVDTATNQPVLLWLESGAIVGRVSGSNEIVFTLTVNSAGTVTLDQQRAISHTPDAGADQPAMLSAANLITLTATITDSDGDQASAIANIGGALTFRDDGPSVSANPAGLTLVHNDESATGSTAPQINTGLIAIGNDPDVPGAGAISVAVSSASVVSVTASYGADGAALTDALTYALTVTNALSGLKTTDGSAINLVQVGDVVVGQVSGGDFDGQAAFAIAIDPATGFVRVEQYLSLQHPDGADPDDMVQLLAGSLGVVVTATDRDGDVAMSGTADISAQIRFDDDGPSISNVAGGAMVELDETGGFDSVISAAPVITADLAYGADGAALVGAISYGIELTAGGTTVASGLATAVGDFPITLVVTSATTIIGRFNDGGGDQTAFSLSIGTDGRLTVTQFVALEHLQDGEAALHNDVLTLAGLIRASVTIKDADGDTATAKTDVGGLVKFFDDGPVAAPDANSVLEGAIVGGNVLTDNADSFGADGPDATAPAGGVVGVRAAGGDTVTPVTTGTGTVISTIYGDLTLNADGSYSYDAKPNTTATLVTDVFVYTIRDADGDTSTTTLTITIQPVTLIADNQTRTVDEAALDLNQDGQDVAPGTVTGSNPTATAETVTGTLAVTGSAGISYTPQTVEDALGKFVLDASGNYTYTLKSAFDGATLDNGVTTEFGVRQFTYTATDTNGNSITGTVTIDIIDDVPTARADTDEVTEDTDTVATGNVLTGVGTTNAPGSADTAGADGAAVTGVATGVSATPVSGNVGGAIAGSYGSLTLNANGGYTYNLNNGLPVVQALGVNETLTESFTYTITDGDGDTSTTTLTITIKGSNDAPTIGTASTAVSEEGLMGGLPDTAGTSDTTNLAVRMGTIAVSDPDGDALTVSLSAPATALSSGGQPIVWDDTDPHLLLGKVGSTTIIQVEIDNSGNFTVRLLGPIDHPNMTVEDALSLVVPVSVSDGTTSANSTLTISIEDDAPVAIAPFSASVTNVAGSSVFRFLDSDNDVDNNYGGDGAGKVIFGANAITSLQGQNLTSGGAPLTYSISPDGTALTAEKANGDDVFIIRLQPAGSPDQYQVEIIRPLDAVTQVDFGAAGYDFSGGNPAWNFFRDAATPNSKDILLTPIGPDGKTVNTNANEGGIGGGQGGNAIAGGEGMRIDFVIDVLGNPPSGGSGYQVPANRNHTFSDHYLVNGASAVFSSTSGSTVRFATKDDPDGNNVVGDGTADPITAVAIRFGAQTVTVNTSATPQTVTVGTRTYTVTFTGGEVLISGIVTNTQVALFTADGYNSMEISYVSGSSFGIGDFGASAITTTDPVPFTVPVAIVDGDGDTVAGGSSVLNITANPATPPIALDLDGDGVEYLATSSGVMFDFAGTGSPILTAWVGPNDGLLAFDANGNGRVDDGTELVFGGNGLTDLQGLAAKYDSNGDGLLTSADAGWARFGVWRDANSNGVSDEGEFRSLDDMGIVSIKLVSNGAGYTTADGDVYVHGETSYRLADGSERTAADSAFAYKPVPAATIRTADRPANAPLADALVAASLIAVAQASGLTDVIAPEVFAAHDTGSAVTVVAPTAAIAAAPDATMIDALPAAAGPAGDAPRGPSIGEADMNDAPRALSIADDAASGWRDGHGDDHAATGSDALFDMGPDHGWSPGEGMMDGLLALAALPTEGAAIADTMPEAAADNADVARVLAEAIHDGGLDHLVDAFGSDGALLHVAGDGGSAFDLARFLDQPITADMGMPANTTLEAEFQSAAAS